MTVIKWSHSSLKAFETCARQFHELKVLKRYPQEETEQMRYGTDLHQAAEDYVRDGVCIPPQFAFIKDTVDALLAKPGRKLPEYEMALDVDLRPCGFKDDNVWVRGIADLLIIDDDNLTARVVDYKSGGDKYPDTSQLELMALMVFAHFPHIRRVHSALLFVVKGSMYKHRMHYEEKDAAWWKYRERVAKLAAAHESGVWNPTQSGLCKRYCAVTTCEFNGRH